MGDIQNNLLKHKASKFRPNISKELKKYHPHGASKRNLTGLNKVPKSTERSSKKNLDQENNLKHKTLVLENYFDPKGPNKEIHTRSPINFELSNRTLTLSPTRISNSPILNNIDGKYSKKVRGTMKTKSDFILTEILQSSS
jgi:hypothetical protein